jgi:hypothetical protein
MLATVPPAAAATVDLTGFFVSHLRPFTTAVTAPMILPPLLYKLISTIYINICDDK